MPNHHYNQTARRGRPFVLFTTTLIALIIASSPMSVPAIAAWHHDRIINAPAYLQSKGHWETIDLPKEFRLNSIHAATLPTGKVLLVAGSGNNRDNFNAYRNDGMMKVLKSVILDPDTMAVKNIDTPSDLFCSGHAMLQSGNLLIAGGTSGYELLEGDVSKPAGAMVIHNENPDDKPRTLKKGTVFKSDDGKQYVSTQEVVVQPATKVDRGDGDVTITRSSIKVFVEAIKADNAFMTSSQKRYDIVGLKGQLTEDLYGQGGPMTLDKQDYRGDDKAYEFDPVAEKYIRVGDMNESRWYPSLPVLTNGNVLAVSGLDSVGKITTTTETYDPATQGWTLGPNQALPTYPALFRTQDPNVLFYSASSAGYGPADVGRQPGFWNVQTNAFKPVAGLRDSDITETSASVVLPPKAGSNDGSQSSRIMIMGGGGVGESNLVTARTDIIDLSVADPTYTSGPDLPAPLRYVNVTVTPWDSLFVSGGTADYRSKGNSYSYKSVMIDPATGAVAPMADSTIGRGYHSGSLLLRDGRILTFGNDPLYSNKDNTSPGTFEQRLEIYTPPQLYKSSRPVITGTDSQQAGRGQTLSFTSSDAASLKTARLIPPSSTTHVTNLEQRSIGVVVKTDGKAVSVQLPANENVLTNGWYMLFFMNQDGTPSRAKMVQITR